MSPRLDAGLSGKQEGFRAPLVRADARGDCGM